MAVFKCKCCGAPLKLQGKERVVECEYCGADNTLPRIDEDKILNLYDRANHYRRNLEYDKALAIFEQILNEDRTEAEAYWSILLCKFGVVYVEDPQTHKRVPTVNRMQNYSIMADEDYKATLKYATEEQISVYKKEAKKLEEIQKGIFAILENEQPYDVFISYKETDENGNRTQDSVYAYDIYRELEKEGLKVFFSRISLEDKIGVSYEPYIFAALNSSKVMLVVGSKPEYINAVWVKNEWSRFLALIKAGEKKTLVPVVYEMSPYDLPDEFSHLQAQQMNYLGAIQDLARGVKKIVGNNSGTTSSGGGAQVSEASLLERVYMFLEESQFEKADEYIEKVLDVNPKSSKAYLAKVLSLFKFNTIDELKYKLFNSRSNSALLGIINTSLMENANFEKAYTYADSTFRQQLDEIQKERYYNLAKERIKTIDKAFDEDGKSLLDIMEYYIEAVFYAYVNKGYKDSDEILDKIQKEALDCLRLNISVLQEDQKEILSKLKVYKNPILKKDNLPEDFYNTVNKLISDYNEESAKKALEEKERKYQAALLKFNYSDDRVKRMIMTNKLSEYILLENMSRAALPLFETIKGYKDVDEILGVIKQIWAKKLQLEEIERIKQEKKKKKMLIILVVIVVCIIIASISVVAIINNQKNKEKYQTAMAYVEENNYKEARKILADLDYGDSQKIYDEIKYKNLEKGESINMGYIVDTGKYFMGGSSKEENIKWTVMKVEDNKAMLLSNKVLTYYDSNYKKFQTEKLNSWSDDTLLTKWFDDIELEHMLETNVSEDASNPNNVVLYPLSLEEYNEFIADEVLKDIVMYSKNARYMSDFLEEYDSSDYTGMNLHREYWYLRTYAQGGNKPLYCVTTKTGELTQINTEAYNGFYSGFRPAVWVSLDE